MECDFLMGIKTIITKEASFINGGRDDFRREGWKGKIAECN